ncbi:MAG: L-histidine N(alpha)-methyltransferase [Chloroflexi bacterium]|nr:L-histidine N(alpha)-methyltransferase [Chloroflexota bacterium]
MANCLSLTVHSSQFPAQVRADLLQSLRSRQINHKFLYDSVKQAQKWLALHEAFSPARTDPNCAEIYDLSFQAAVAAFVFGVGSAGDSPAPLGDPPSGTGMAALGKRTSTLAAIPHAIPSGGSPNGTGQWPVLPSLNTRAAAFGEASAVHVIGLGCGGGQKEARLLQRLRRAGKAVAYTPCDVSTALVLAARQAAQSVVSATDCHPIVCDLATCDELAALLDSSATAEAARLITFFGMMPNFEPTQILPCLAGAVRRQDFMLLSANLAPGPDYEAGVRRVLPLYDNDLTRDWLLTFLFDLGVDRADGELRFSVCAGPAGSGLRRIEASFHFGRSRAIQVAGEQIEFRAGDLVRLFFSYRYTPDRIHILLRPYGLTVLRQWITRSEEEGVFLCGRAA